MTSREIYYFIHNLEDETIRIEATYQQNVENIYKMEISTNNNVEIPTSMYNGILADRITSLTLARCQLRNLPNALFAPNLIELDLSYNNFTEVPDWIVKSCLKLQIINLSYNKLSSFHVPKCSRELRFINISHNKLNIIPVWIFSSSCSELETLDISANPLQTYLLSLRGRCLKNLRVLLMNNCNFRSDYVKIVREIPRLKVLSIANTSPTFSLNLIQQMPFQTFYCVSSLTELNLSGLAIASLNDEISWLTALEKLNISHNHLSWLPDNFTNLKSLKVLDASYNELFSLPENIGKLENLCELYIAKNIIGSLPESIKSIQNLITLDCYNNDLTIAAWDLINEMPNIQAIDFEQNSLQMSDSEQYIEKREKLRRNTNNLLRENGSKYEICDSSEDSRSLNSFSSDYSEENDVIETNDLEEENWDTEDYDADDNLILPPFKFIIVPKRKHYDPSDYIDPVYFEDALDDHT